MYFHFSAVVAERFKPEAGLFLPTAVELLPKELFPIEMHIEHRGINCIFAVFRFSDEIVLNNLRFSEFELPDDFQRVINLGALRSAPVGDEIVYGLSVASSTFGLSTKCGDTITASESDLFWKLTNSADALFAFSSDGEIFLLLDEQSNSGFVLMRD